jgi:hypothetical protein
MAKDSSTSIPSSVTARWLSFVMPSIADLIFIGVFAVLLFTPVANRLLGDAGTGWHIRTGEQILATHAVPHTDPFSSSMAGKPWFAWEWLYDVVVGELHIRTGLNGIVWFTTLVIASVFAWIYRLLISRGVDVLTALVLTMLALYASMIHFLARPHVLSWLLVLAWFWILDSTERNDMRSNRLWLLPPLMLIWVNVHGGFLIGFVLLAIFWIGAVWDFYATKENRIEESFARIAAAKRVWQLVSVALVSVAVSLVNPYGWKLHAHIYSYLSNSFLMDHVDEFKSPNFHGVAQKCFAVLLLITVATVAARGRRLRASDTLTVLFAIYTGLYATRNIPVSSILLVMIVAPLLRTRAPHERSLDDGFFSRMTRIEARSQGHLWCAIFALLTLFISMHDGRIGSRQLVHANFDASRMPVKAINFIQQSELKGPVFAPDSWGGYVIYRLHPREKVVLDDRHDLYGEEFLKSYLTTLHGERGWQRFLREREIGCMILPKDIALTSLLLETGTWKPIYNDSLAIVFIPNSHAPNL